MPAHLFSNPCESIPVLVFCTSRMVWKRASLEKDVPRHMNLASFSTTNGGAFRYPGFLPVLQWMPLWEHMQPTLDIGFSKRSCCNGSVSMASLTVLRTCCFVSSYSTDTGDAESYQASFTCDVDGCPHGKLKDRPARDPHKRRRCRSGLPLSDHLPGIIRVQHTLDRIVDEMDWPGQQPA